MSHCPFRDQHPYMTSCGCGYGRRPGGGRDESEIADLLADAPTVHLLPDDVIVVRLPAEQMTPDVAKRLRDLLHPRKVVIITEDIHIGHAGARFGEVAWDLS